MYERHYYFADVEWISSSLVGLDESCVKLIFDLPGFLVQRPEVIQRVINHRVSGVLFQQEYNGLRP